MYDEYETVKKTIENCRSYKMDIYIVHSIGPRVPGGSDDYSFNNTIGAYPERVAIYTKLPSLGGEYSKWALPAHALARNYALLFSQAHSDRSQSAIAITGDTLIEDPSYLIHMAQKMSPSVDICTMKAWGQDFHHASLTEEQLDSGISGGRVQINRDDFQPQLFVCGTEAIGLLRNIPITNPWCSEQCLGDAVHGLRQYVYCYQAYDFHNGVRFHVK